MGEEEFITSIYKEKCRIQKALLSVGYSAHIVKFMPDMENCLPRVEIEAFPATDGEMAKLEKDNGSMTDEQAKMLPPEMYKKYKEWKHLGKELRLL